ncbi:hypothetical protein NDU88_001500 [Pleurodeles waltl]|uniref:Uncharacterized protein n=1 Tax=Pleurodeles waltl TaxID=8319 RepID=A0AAV7NCM0_PLEWA|nr:hypothetical protein NDU88_001500 [Pleurodeles waltl]
MLPPRAPTFLEVFCLRHPRALQATAIRGMCLLPQVLGCHFACLVAGPPQRFSAALWGPNDHGCAPPAGTPLCTMRRHLALWAAAICGVYLTLQVIHRHFMCPAAGPPHRLSASLWSPNVHGGAPLVGTPPRGKRGSQARVAAAIRGGPLCTPAALNYGYSAVTKLDGLPASPLLLLHWSRPMSEAPLSCPHFSLRPATTSDPHRGYM